MASPPRSRGMAHAPAQVRSPRWPSCRPARGTAIRRALVGAGAECAQGGPVRSPLVRSTISSRIIAINSG